MALPITPHQMTLRNIANYSPFHTKRIAVVVGPEDAPEMFAKFRLPDTKVRLKCSGDGMPTVFFDLPYSFVCADLPRGFIPIRGTRLIVTKHPDYANAPEFYCGRSVIGLAE